MAGLNDWWGENTAQDWAGEGLEGEPWYTKHPEATGDKSEFTPDGETKISITIAEYVRLKSIEAIYLKMREILAK